MPIPHILVVEDDPSIREMIRLFFEAQEIRVTLACDGQEALELFEQASGGVPARGFDLVITDLQMPRMSGKELISILKNKSSYPPSILCSAVSPEEALVKNQADAFLKKPYTFDELQQMVLHLLKTKN